MLGKSDEVEKETEQIIKYFLLKMRYEVNQAEIATHSTEHIPENTSIPEVTAKFFGGLEDHPFIDSVGKDIAQDAPFENLVADISCEARVMSQ